LTLIANIHTTFPAGNNTLQYTAPSNGTFYIQVIPVAISPQPSVYGVGGFFDLSVTFPEGAGNFINFTCPTVGIPACVNATGVKIRHNFMVLSVEISKNNFAKSARIGTTLQPEM
jgi:hypothetical protein